MMFIPSVHIETGSEAFLMIKRLGSKEAIRETNEMIDRYELMINNMFPFNESDFLRWDSQIHRLLTLRSAIEYYTNQEGK